MQILVIVRHKSEFERNNNNHRIWFKTSKTQFTIITYAIFSKISIVGTICRMKNYNCKNIFV